MPVLALLAFAAYIGVAFAFRTWLQYRRTGDTGLRGFPPGVPFACTAWLLWVAGLLLAPAAALLELAADPGGSAVSRLSVAQLGAAGAVLCAGFAITVAGQLQMGSSWRVGVRSDEQTALVTHGLYRFARNPIFSGILLTVAGLALLVPDALSAVAVLCALGGLQLQTRAVEEPYLLSVHGAHYRDYARRVGRFFPGVGRLR